MRHGTHLTRHHTVKRACLPRGPAARPRRGPREKLRAWGPTRLADAELLALVLGSGTAGRSALAIGRALARRRPSELAEWSIERWGRIPGIGPARAAALIAAFELGRRAVAHPLAAPVI